MIRDCSEGDHRCCLNGYYPTLYSCIVYAEVKAQFGCLLAAKRYCEKNNICLIQTTKSEMCEKINRDWVVK